MRFQKGLLMMQNKASLKKFHIMAQTESRMTLQKAMALWKHNSEVQGIEGLLEKRFRNLTLIKLSKILSR
jgi:hypothetical protein